MDELRGRRCRPIARGEPALAPERAAALLAGLAGGWQVVGGERLRREWRFPDFSAALAFALRVGAVAEREDHHPELRVGWGRVEVELSTHVVGGLTENDFVLAAQLDALEPGPGTDSPAR